MKIRPVILSGGSGTRLWPVSRRCFPKQFAPLIGDESLFVTALKRVQDRSLFAPPIIVGNADHKFLILDALQTTGISDARIFLEPEGRNTAAAAFTAAIGDKNEDVLHLVMPSDHVIKDQAAFVDAIRTGIPAAENGNIILFGMKPASPETEYGYIVPGDKTEWACISHINFFKEKPDTAAAAKLIEKGALWNGGIFLYSPALLIKEASILAPDYISLCKEALLKAHEDLGCIMLAKEPYAQIKPEPFDRLIMEKTKRGCVIPCSVGWSDAGSWQAMWQIGKPDESGNVFTGEVVAHDVSGAYIHSDGPMIAVAGVKDIAVIATRDAVLVAPRDRSQDVKALVAQIGQRSPAHADHHAHVLRPWGTYENLARGDNFQVKHIVVQPGRSLSLQKHHHRAEHWVVVVGTAKIECDGTEEIVFPNESVFVPRGSIHRLSNPGKIALHLIEVQSGDYLGEDDIIRFDDPYGQPQEVTTAVPLRKKRANGAA